MCGNRDIVEDDKTWPPTLDQVKAAYKKCGMKPATGIWYGASIDGGPEVCCPMTALALATGRRSSDIPAMGSQGRWARDTLAKEGYKVPVQALSFIDGVDGCVYNDRSKTEDYVAGKIIGDAIRKGELP